MTTTLVEVAEKTDFSPGTRGVAGYRPLRAIYWPHYGLAMGGLNGMDGLGMRAWLDAANAPQATTYDAVPRAR